MKRNEVRPIDDLRSYITALEAHGQLHRVKAEVDWKYELCHVSKVNEEKQGPALLYENVKGHSIPVLTSAFTTPERIAFALEPDPGLTMCQLSRKWMELTTKQLVKPTFVDKPPVMENVIAGDDVVPWLQKLHNCSHGRATRGKCKPVRASFQCSNAGFKTMAIRIVRTGVLIAFVVSWPALRKRRG